MADDNEAAEDERAIELSSIAAIYPEISIDDKDPYRAALDLAVSPLQPLKIQFQAPLAGGQAPALPTSPTPPSSTELGDNIRKQHAQQAPVELYELEHLPPLRLAITLPKDYPATKPPAVEVHVTPQWLPKSTLTTLEEDCGRLWEELGRDQVLFTYIDHLQQGAENAFGRVSDGEDGHGVQLSGDLKIALLDFDLKTKREKFERETFDCGICLEPKKGKDCHRLSLCSHVFCVACLQDFYNSCIQEGDVDNVKCLDPGCGKDDSMKIGDEGRPAKRRKQDRSLNPSELLQIPIAQEPVQRYLRLKRKKKLESDKNTIYCPRQWCQGAAKSKKHPKPVSLLNDIDEVSSGSEAENETSPQPKKKEKTLEDIPMSERLCVCEDCDFAFCRVCKKGWHGELSICNPRRQAELNAEEKASVAYLQKYSTACPTCNAPSQKTMGCNHMICFKCKTHFCYLCSSYLMEDNPYKHFNNMKSTCYMRLWELEGGDGEGADHLFGGLPAAEWEPENDGRSDSDDDDNASIEDFGGSGDEDDDLFFREEDDTSDEEPAPDIQRNRGPQHIEIVNFNARGAANQRIMIPERPRAQAQQQPPPPPAAPVPPRRRRGQGQQANHDRRQRNEPHRNPRRPAAAAPARLRPGAQDIRPNPDIIQAGAAPGQGAGFAAQQPAPVRAMGLERFLQLAQVNQEDEWDSDELEDEIDELDLVQMVRQDRRARDMNR